MRWLLIVAVLVGCEPSPDKAHQQRVECAKATNGMGDYAYELCLCGCDGECPKTFKEE